MADLLQMESHLGSVAPSPSRVVRMLIGRRRGHRFCHITWQSSRHPELCRRCYRTARQEERVLL